MQECGPASSIQELCLQVPSASLTSRIVHRIMLEPKHCPDGTELTAYCFSRYLQRLWFYPGSYRDGTTSSCPISSSQFTIWAADSFVDEVDSVDRSCVLQAFCSRTKLRKTFRPRPKEKMYTVLRFLEDMSATNIHRFEPIWRQCLWFNTATLCEYK
jgi:hypothetical protein